MTIAAAIQITSAGEERVIRHAVSFAAQAQLPCFVIAVVDELPYGRDAGDAREVVRSNLALIEELGATPVMQEGERVAETLLAVTTGFGVRTLFVQSGPTRGLGRTLADELLYRNPPFDVVIVSGPAIP
jgi:K+-sensing histidine kinase KdpD